MTDPAEDQRRAATAQAAGQVIRAIARNEARNATARAQTETAELQAIGADRARYTTLPGDLQQILPAGVQYAPEQAAAPLRIEDVLRQTRDQDFKPDNQAHQGQPANAPQAQLKAESLFR